jgi:hypothetical protein
MQTLSRKGKQRRERPGLVDASSLIGSPVLGVVMAVGGVDQAAVVHFELNGFPGYGRRPVGS